MYTPHKVPKRRAAQPSFLYDIGDEIVEADIYFIIVERHRWIYPTQIIIIAATIYCCADSASSVKMLDADARILPRIGVGRAISAELILVCYRDQH